LTLPCLRFNILFTKLVETKVTANKGAGMKNWKYTLYFGFGGCLLLPAFTLLPGDSEGIAGILERLMVILYLPVFSFVYGAANFWFSVFQTSMNWYISIIILLLGTFLQFAIIGHAIDHVVYYLKRKPDICEPKNTTQA